MSSLEQFNIYLSHSTLLKLPNVLLLAFRADVNLPNEGTLMTAAHAAAFQGYGKILMILIEYGANLQTRDKYDNSTVDYASANDAIWPLFASKLTGPTVGSVRTIR